MKDKESLWALIKRLDEQAGALNEHLNKANEYFDQAALQTNKLLVRHQKDLHKTIIKVRKALKAFKKKEKKVEKKKK